MMLLMIGINVSTYVQNNSSVKQVNSCRNKAEIAIFSLQTFAPPTFSVGLSSFLKPVFQVFVCAQFIQRANSKSELCRRQWMLWGACRGNATGEIWLLHKHFMSKTVLILFNKFMFFSIFRLLFAEHYCMAWIMHSVNNIGSSSHTQYSIQMLK